MKLSFTKLPFDLCLFILWSILVIPFSLLNISETVRIILGLPFILFIPGYILIFALFPSKKSKDGIDVLERIALSFALSIALTPLIGLGLNYTPWGIRLEPILAFLLLFIISVGGIGFYRWFKTEPNQRFTISFAFSISPSEKKIDTLLTIVLIIVIIITLISLIYVIALPKTGETFTEFYLLGPTGNADGYPSNITLQQNTSIIIGLNNHEYRPINYTIEIWLIDQTINTTNQTIYNHMWYLDNITVSLPHQPIDAEQTWQPQWTYNYTIRINQSGTFKLVFLLFTIPTPPYNTSQDYYEIAEEKILSAYREIHLWITIN